MSTILLTGANGFLGQAILNDLSQRHEVITICRRKLPGAPNQTHYEGTFSSSHDLMQLDAHRIDAVVHLAAVTGGCSEHDGMLVNVEGTRSLMRYLIDHGCKKFVNASSIAVVGLESPDFRPVSLPMADDHPCLDKHGYGFSKYMMEEVTRYLSRQNPAIDIINLRLAAIYPDEQPPAKIAQAKLGPWAAATITQMSRSEATGAFVSAVESACKPGLRILNATSKQAWSEGPTVELLRSWWGDDVDLSAMEASQDQRPSIFDTSSIARELNF